MPTLPLDPRTARLVIIALAIVLVVPSPLLVNVAAHDTGVDGLDAQQVIDATSGTQRATPDAAAQGGTTSSTVVHALADDDAGTTLHDPDLARGDALASLYRPFQPLIPRSGIESIGNDWTPADGLAPGDPETFQAQCARPADGTPRVVESGSEIIVYDCPIRIYDRGYSFTSIDLAADPSDPERFVFSSLHGAPRDDQASPLARDGDTHTRFLTEDRGLGWEDNPIVGDSVPEGHYGVDSVATIDDDGDVHMVDHWLKTRADGSHESILHYHRSDHPRAQGNLRMAYTTSLEVELGAKAAVHDVGVATLTTPANTSQPGADGHATAEEDSNGTEATQHVVITWLGAPTDSTDATEGRIHLAWASAHTPENLTYLPDNATIGPCDDMSAPIAYGQRILIACGEPMAAVGDERIVSVHAIDIQTGSTERLDEIALGAGRVHLDIAANGFTALATSTLGADGTPLVPVAFGVGGQDLGAASADLGSSLHSMLGGLPLDAARLTALQVSEQTNTVFAVYHERRDIDMMDHGSAVARGAAADGTMPGEYAKLIVAFDNCEFPTAAARFDLGTGIDPVNAEAYGRHPGAFDDRRDGLTLQRLPTGEERLTFALTDYGAALFGHFPARAGAGFCAPPTLPPVMAQGAVPNGLPEPNGMMSAYGALVGLGSSAMVGYLLMTRKKATNPLATGA